MWNKYYYKYGHCIRIVTKQLKYRLVRKDLRQQKQTLLDKDN